MPPKDGLEKLHNACSEDPPNPVAPCAKKTHWIKVHLSYKDDKSKVKAAKCTIAQGGAVIQPGPLANGTLGATSGTGGTYDVSFPDIDATEWEKA